MPRTIEVAVPTQESQRLIDGARGVRGVVGISIQRGASIAPPGDVVSIRCSNDATRGVMAVLIDAGLDSRWSVSMNEPQAMVAPSGQDLLNGEGNETVWEEMGFLLRRDTNIALNYVALMALSGAITAAGLWTDTLHYVLAAMILAPGIETLLRVPMGLVAGPRSQIARGLASTALGYLALAVGAVIMLLLLMRLDRDASTDLVTRHWVVFWSTLSGPGLGVSLAAAASGAFVVAAKRPNLLVGTMIGMALVPSSAIAAMGFAQGDFPLAWGGLRRWALDVALAITVGGIVFWLKLLITHRRRALA